MWLEQRSNTLKYQPKNGFSKLKTNGNHIYYKILFFFNSKKLLEELLAINKV